VDLVRTIGFSVITAEYLDQAAEMIGEKTPKGISRG